MLAIRLSFTSELANLAKKVGAEIEMVRQGIPAKRGAWWRHGVLRDRTLMQQDQMT